MWSSYHHLTPRHQLIVVFSSFSSSSQIYPLYVCVREREMAAAVGNGHASCKKGPGYATPLEAMSGPREALLYVTCVYSGYPSNPRWPIGSHLHVQFLPALSLLSDLVIWWGIRVAVSPCLGWSQPADSIIINLFILKSLGSCQYCVDSLFLASVLPFFLS